MYKINRFDLTLDVLQYIGYWLWAIGYRTASPIGRLFEAMGRGKAAMGERRRV